MFRITYHTVREQPFLKQLPDLGVHIEVADDEPSGLKINGTAWKELPLYKPPMPKRKMFREHELKNVSDAREISTDFVVRIEKERVAAGGSYDKSTDTYTFRVETNNRFEIDWVKNRVSYQQEKGLVVTVPGHQLGENGVTLAVETKSGTRKVTMNWSDLEDNFTVSIDGMPVRLMPLYEEAAD